MHIGGFLVTLLIGFLFHHGYCSAIDCSVTPKNSKDFLAKLQVEVICKNGEYDVRPVKSNTTSTVVSMVFRPKLISINEETETMKVNGFIEMTWQDEFCSWNPSEYGAIKQVEVDHYDLWRPKLTSADYYRNGWYDFLDDIDHYSMREMSVNFRGNVQLKMVVELYGPCTFDLISWPDDIWSCEITLGKKSDEDGYVQVHFPSQSALDRSMLNEDKNWDILTISDPALNSTNGEYVALKVDLKRKWSTIRRIYLIPLFVSLIITLIPFWLTDKIFIRLITHFLTTFLQVVLLQFIFWHVSESHGLRTIAMYDLYLHGICFNLIGITITAINAKFGTNTEDPPNFIVSFLSTLAYIPYVGVCCSVLMNDQIEKVGAFESDEETLVSGSKVKCNQKWRAFLNFIDKSAFFSILLFVLLDKML